MTSGDGAGDAFTLLTTEPGPDIAPIHDRQMVVLERADWLLGLTLPGQKWICSVRYRPARWVWSR